MNNIFYIQACMSKNAWHFSNYNLFLQHPKCRPKWVFVTQKKNAEALRVVGIVMMENVFEN